MKQDSKVQVIMEFLLKGIASGRWGNGQKVPSEYELAEQFSVNKTTANKAVASLVARKILMRRKGPGGTVVACGGQYPVGRLGYLIQVPQASYFGSLLNGAQAAASLRDYALQYLEPTPQMDRELFWDRLRSSNLQGLLVTQYGSVPVDMPFPVIYVDSSPVNKERCHWIDSDNVRGGRLLGDFLLEQGHSQCVFASSHSSVPSMAQRASGFIDALTMRGVAQASERIVPLSMTSKPNFGIFWQNVRNKLPDTSAIAFDADPYASHFISWLLREGIQLPHGFMVTGFGACDEYHQFCRFPTIDHHPKEMGAHAANRLMDMIETPTAEMVQDVLPVELISGERITDVLCRRIEK